MNINALAAQLNAWFTGTGEEVTATVTGHRIDIKDAAFPNANFVRVIIEDEEATGCEVVHMRHNEVILGEARISGSMIQFLPRMIADLMGVDTD